VLLRACAIAALAAQPALAAPGHDGPSDMANLGASAEHGPPPGRTEAPPPIATDNVPANNGNGNGNGPPVAAGSAAEPNLPPASLPASPPSLTANSGTF